MNAIEYAKKQGATVSNRKGVVTVRYSKKRTTADFNEFHKGLCDTAKRIKKALEEEGYNEIINDWDSRFSTDKKDKKTSKFKMRFERVEA